MKVELTGERFFTCDDADVAMKLTFIGTPEAASGDLAKYIAKPAAKMELPDLGSVWREMTDEEVDAYLKAREEQAKEDRLQRLMEEDDE